MANTSSRHFLVLWDIDGTLVRMADGLPGNLFEDMVLELFGRHVSLRGMSFAGKTDRGILRDIAIAVDLPMGELRERDDEIIGWLSTELEKRITSSTLTLLPGVKPLLDTMHTRKDTTQALLTGNMPPFADIKLGVHGLMHYFKFGVFGVESENRNDLGPIALERAIEYLDGRALASEDVVVLGDSVRDVECARAIGARAIITLTGSTLREEIEPFAPFRIFPDLSDTEAVLTAIYGS